MTHVVVSIGSNINREKNIRFAVDEIKNKYGEIQLSPVYDSSAEGFDGPPFLNLVVGFWVGCCYSQVRGDLLGIENRAGREHREKAYDNRTLDIDILLFGDANLRHQKINIPRGEIESHIFVLKPLADLYPDLRHPISDLLYCQILENFGDSENQLTQIDFDFQQ